MTGNVFTGVMGGVTSMDGFLQDYFPSVAAQQASVNTPGNLYCQYDSQTLQLMTSVLFISGAITEITGTTGEAHSLASAIHMFDCSKRCDLSAADTASSTSSPAGVKFMPITMFLAQLMHLHCQNTVA